VKENILSSIHCDESVTFGAIEEFHCTCHASTLSVNRKTESPGKWAGAYTL
jgi:hypothetical protein